MHPPLYAWETSKFEFVLHFENIFFFLTSITTNTNNFQIPQKVTHAYNNPVYILLLSIMYGTLIWYGFSLLFKINGHRGHIV